MGCNSQKFFQVGSPPHLTAVHHLLESLGSDDYCDNRFLWHCLSSAPMTHVTSISLGAPWPICAAIVCVRHS